MTDIRPDIDRILADLKPFQRATVEHVFARLWGDEDSVDRFLVADEVGLGKTLVAKGVAAKAIDHLWAGAEESGSPITIVYICSNHQIARQNLERLSQLTDGVIQSNADRLTLLPLSLQEAEGRRVQVVAFTPGTSLALGRATGRIEERALLKRMLVQAFPDHDFSDPTWTSYLAVDASEERFDGTAAWLKERGVLPEGLIVQFRDRLLSERGPEDDGLFTELLRNQEAWDDECVPDDDALDRRKVIISQLRIAMAHVSIDLLRPDLVILDEFQRFKDLFSDADADTTTSLTGAQKLAQQVISKDGAKTLVLSATPYKMYTLADDADGDDHYRDFTNTIAFLAGREPAQQVTRWLSTMRKGMMTGTPDSVAAADLARRQAEAELRTVMSRTERLAATADRNGMLTIKEFGDLRLDPADVRGWLALDDIAQVLGVGNPFEFWRAGPYTHNLMDRWGYKMQEKLLAQMEAGDAGLARTLRRHRKALLPWPDIREYEAVDPANAKLRALIEDMASHDAWRLVWISPSLPYLEPAGVYASDDARSFTKRLIFSAWNVVPKTIASLVSYDMERRAVQADPSAAAQDKKYDSSSQSAPLGFGWDSARDAPRNLTNLTVIYPSVVLARLGDPLTVAKDTGHSLPLDPETYGLLVHDRIEKLLVQAGVKIQHGGDEARRVADGARRRWYGVAPVLLDRVVAAQEGWTAELPMRAWSDRQDGSRLADHALWAEKDIEAMEEEFGPPPDDLASVLTAIAAAGPGVCALRAITRSAHSESALYDLDVRSHALHAALGLRNLFNRPTIVSVVRGATEDAGADADSYWRQVLRYCFDGNLQAVLDEYCHMLKGAGLEFKALAEQAETLARHIHESASIRTAQNAVHHFKLSGGMAHADVHHLKSHIAARFGRAATSDEASNREATVREGFNSPFWPFVLASTSVGQEGLDFHTYSHAVVHWNLPSNPVDLEQREGRVHRFKGHAVRRNVADEYGTAAIGEKGDPWTRMFDAAEAARPDGDSLLDPYWVKTGAAAIERYVPAMPLSKESRRYSSLVRTVGAYRYVMGQPRQEELIRYMGPHAEGLKIDLSPPEFREV